MAKFALPKIIITAISMQNSKIRLEIFMAGHIHWLYHAAVVKGTDILGKHSAFFFRFNVKITCHF